MITAEFSLALQALAKKAKFQMKTTCVVLESEIAFFFPEIKLAVDFIEDSHQHTDAYFEFARKKEILAQAGIYYVLVESFDAENRLQDINQLLMQNQSN